MDKNANNPDGPKPLKDCLIDASLRKLVARTQHILSIKKVLQAWLPPELREHCQILNIENAVLTLAGDSAAFATRLRYLTPELMDVLNSTNSIPTIKHITYRVIPQTLKKSVTRKRLPPLSSKTLTLLQQTAKNIKNPQLKKSLEKISTPDK